MSPIRKVLMGLTILMALTGGVTAYLHLTKPKPLPVKEKVKQQKRKIKRTYNSDGKLASEEIDEVLTQRWTKPVIKPKPYLLGATLGYDFDKYRIKYNVIAGKQVTEDCYAIGKASTDLSLSSIEAGALCVF